MKKLLYVHGDGGHGHAVTAAALDLGYEVVQTDKKYNTEPPLGSDCIFAIGRNADRKKCNRQGMVSIVHPAAFVSQGSQVGRGSYIGPKATIIAGAKISTGCIINTSAIVEHDCWIGPWCHISPGAVLCGNVTIGEGCWIGANATIREGRTIAPWSIVGCGSTVIRDIEEAGTYVGSPVRRL